jgi:hypothetical protein
MNRQGNLMNDPPSPGVCSRTYTMLMLIYLPAFITTVFRSMPGVWKSQHRLLLCWLIVMQAVYPGRKTLHDSARWSPRSITEWRLRRLLKASYWCVHLLLEWLARDVMDALPPADDGTIYVIGDGSHKDKRAIDLHPNNCTVGSLGEACLPPQLLHHTDHFGRIVERLLKGSQHRSTSILKCGEIPAVGRLLLGVFPELFNRMLGGRIRRQPVDHQAASRFHLLLEGMHHRATMVRCPIFNQKNRTVIDRQDVLQKPHGSGPIEFPLTLLGEKVAMLDLDDATYFHPLSFPTRRDLGLFAPWRPGATS